MTTPVTGLPEITDGQASPGATHNQALRELTAKTVRVLSRTTAVEPGSPADGDAYILPSGFSGASWGGSAVNRIAHFIGGVWQFYTPAEGWSVWVNSEDIHVTWNGSAWTDEVGLPRWPCVAVSTTPFSVTASHRGMVLVCDTTSGSITLNLLAVASAGNGFVFAVKKKVAANSLIIDPSGAELIDDATSMTLTDDEDSRIVVTDASEWHAIGGGGSGGGGGITLPVSDATAIFKNDADATKTVKVSLAGLSTGTERTVSYPNKSGTHAFLDDVAPGGNGSDQLAEDSANHNGLLYAYKAGAVRLDNVVTLVSAGTVLLTEGATNYVEITSGGSVSANTTGFTSGRFPMAIVTTLAGSPSGIDTVTDRRAWIQLDAAGNSGSLVRRVTATSTTTSSSTTQVPTDGTIPQDSEGTAYTAVDITYTPVDSANTLEIVFEAYVAGSTFNGPVVSIFRTGTADALAATVLGNGSAVQNNTQLYLKASQVAGSGARTYTIRFGRAGTSGTVYISRDATNNPVFSTASVVRLSVYEYKA